MMVSEIVQAIAITACAEAGVPISAALSRDASPKAIAARRAIYAGLRARGWSYPRIGRAVGRDHTTVRDVLVKANANYPHGGPRFAAQLVANGFCPESFECIKSSMQQNANLSSANA